jgi:hypothetical protein
VQKFFVIFRNDFRLTEAISLSRGFHEEKRLFDLTNNFFAHIFLKNLRDSDSSVRILVIVYY